jgi:putative ABC transport system permease protein
VKTAEVLTLPESGVLITKRMHETCKLETGDRMAFYDSSMVPFEAEVVGIFNNYFGHLAFCSPAAYRGIFGEEVDPNCFFLKLNGYDLETLRAEAAEIDGFLNLSDAASRKAQIENTSKAMDVLILVMIVMAGMMSWFILDSLSGSYMLHKRKELIVMRVNGFSTRECVRYAATELIITTALGILIGVPIGAGLGYYVIRRTEISYLQMDRTLDWRSVVFSILITVIFALIINGKALSKVKDLNLSDAAS